MKKECPACKQKLSANELLIAGRERRRLNSLKIFCPNRFHPLLSNPQDSEPVSSALASVPLCATAASSDASSSVAAPDSQPAPDQMSCDWIGEVSSLDEHLHKCPNAPICCSFCHEFFGRAAYPLHQSLCSRRLVSCPHCSIYLEFWKLEDHFLACPMVSKFSECLYRRDVFFSFFLLSVWMLRSKSHVQIIVMRL